MKKKKLCKSSFGTSRYAVVFLKMYSRPHNNVDLSDQHVQFFDVLNMLG